MARKDGYATPAKAARVRAVKATPKPPKGYLETVLFDPEEVEGLKFQEDSAAGFRPIALQDLGDGGYDDLEPQVVAVYKFIGLRTVKAKHNIQLLPVKAPAKPKT